MKGLTFAKCIALVKKELSERWKVMELEYKLKRKEKRVTCDICYYIFSNQSARDRHREAQHTQNKNTTSSKKDSVTKTSLELKCEECGKVFKQHTSLKRHLVEHESTENYSCKRCDAKFKRKDTLYKHERQVHDLTKVNVDMIRREDVKEYICKMCKSNFGLERVKYEAHLVLKVCQQEKEPLVLDKKYRMLKCDQCERSYNNKDSLQRHVRWKHSISRLLGFFRMKHIIQVQVYTQTTHEKYA